MPGKNWKLSPSDFAFLWEECKCCFYQKVAKGFLRPRPIMPKIFNVIDSQMKAHYQGKRTSDIAAGLPKGINHLSDQWVESVPLSFKKGSSTCFIKGKLDTCLKFDDGSYGVVDFKTSSTKDDHLPLYSRQLHAYALALENAAPGALSLSPISRLGLLVFEPTAFSSLRGGPASLMGKLQWVEISRNDKFFREFLSELLAVLALPKAPPSSAGCEWCAYHERIRAL